MTAVEVLEKLDEIGVTAWLVDGNIRLKPTSRVTPDLRFEIQEGKADIVRELNQSSEGKFEEHSLITLLRTDQEWLVDQHQKSQSGDYTAASDAEFSRAWNAWWELDERLRTDYGFQGCVCGPESTCPDGFPCLGCSDVTTPSVVAQVALTSATSSDD